MNLKHRLTAIATTGVLAITASAAITPSGAMAQSHQNPAAATQAQPQRPNGTFSVRKTNPTSSEIKLRDATFVEHDGRITIQSNSTGYTEDLSAQLSTVTGSSIKLVDPHTAIVTVSSAANHHHGSGGTRMPHQRSWTMTPSVRSEPSGPRSWLGRQQSLALQAHQ